MSVYRIYIWFSILILASIQSGTTKISEPEEFTVFIQTKEITAGQPFTLKFQSTSEETPPLYCSNSYGSTLVYPKRSGDILIYELPELFTKKSGQLNWFLEFEHNQINGQLVIHPIAQTAAIESYIGPPSLNAGNLDFAMMVTIPVDSLDNPMADGSKVSAKEFYSGKTQTDTIIVNHGVAYKIIETKSKSGRILIASESNGMDSKEYTIDVKPAVPSDFTISYERAHAYADGNQIMTFESSVILDENQNIVSNGTYVNFIIKTNQGATLQTSGQTVNGIAKARMIHPERATSWTVKAFVEGMAESNTIALEFQQAVSDYDVEFSEDSRSLKIGPLQSFMEQRIPDGFRAKVSIFQNQKEILKMTKTSVDGFINYSFQKDRLPEGNYTFRIEVAGITKELQNISVW